MPSDDLAHVGVHRFAQVGDRVDERDLGGEERVRRVLDHLGRRRVGHEDRRLHVAVEVGDAHRDRGVVAPDHDAAGVQEVAHRVALAEELGVRRHADVVGGAGLGSSSRATISGRTDRHRRLVDHDRARPRARARSRGTTASTAERSAAPVSRLRRLHAEEHELGVARRGRRRRRRSGSRPEPRPSATSAGRPSSRIGTSPFRQRADPLLVEVGAGHASARGARGTPRW